MIKSPFTKMDDEREASDHDPSRDTAFMARVHQAVESAGGIAALSRKCGLSRGVIHKYLNGESEPSRPRLIALARAANVDVKWLATGEDGPNPAPIGLPELDDEALLGLVVRYGAGIPSMDREERDDFIARTFQHLQTVDGTERRLIALGAALTAGVPAADEMGSSRISAAEKEIFLARDPLFVLWRWRYGRGDCPAIHRKELADPEMAEFQRWQSSLRLLIDSEMMKGVWGGNGRNSKYVFQFFISDGILRNIEITSRRFDAGSIREMVGEWRIVNGNVIAAYCGVGRSRQSYYFIAEGLTGSVYAIVYDGEDISYDSIILLDHIEDESAIDAEFREYLKTPRAIRHLVAAFMVG